MRKSVYFMALSWALLLFASSARADWPVSFGQKFYSEAGREHEVSFSGNFRTGMTQVEQVTAMSPAERASYKKQEILPVFKFLFGPLTHRSLGGPQRNWNAEVNWAGAKVREGRVELPYFYSGTWIVEKKTSDLGLLTIPFPLNTSALYTPSWKNCSDSAPDHQTPSFFWYFWDPDRSGCDHVLGKHYAQVVVKIGKQTVNQLKSFPEYSRLVRGTGSERALQLTFAFGYVEDPASPDPETDWDEGMAEYRGFLATVRQSWGASLEESPISMSEYPDAALPNLKMGHRFEGQVQGVNVTINVVAAAGIDQMDLFAQSFAHDHDGFFAWFGHSRVGSGFDAQRFRQIVESSPSYYSVESQYQLVYWGGCNSYSYYTLPFFEYKAEISGGTDPNGTKGLDIIANGLPSYFALNADNAGILLKHLMNWQGKPSYQTMVGEIEARARQMGIYVLAAVLGDEDNAL